MGARVNSPVKRINSNEEISQGLQEIFVKLFDLLKLRGMSKERASHCLERAEADFLTNEKILHEAVSS